MTAHEHDHAGAPRRCLAAALAIIAGVAVVQVVGAVATGSLALLADSRHMLSDSIGLVVALIATTVAARPATDRATYGFRRAEVLGALVHALLLLGIAIGVGVEAVRRLLTAGSAEVLAAPMLVVALVGRVANVAAPIVLRGGRGDSINLRGAYLEVLGDLAGCLETHFDVAHSTFQLEPATHAAHEPEAARHR